VVFAKNDTSEACAVHVTLCTIQTFKKVKAKVLRGKAYLRTTGCHLPYHTMLLATQHKQTHPALTPAGEGWYSIYLPQRDGRLSWPRWLDCGSRNRRPFDRKSDALIAAPPRHCIWGLFITLELGSMSHCPLLSWPYFWTCSDWGALYY